MTRHPPAFPPDVAAALQEPAGRVSVRYTLPESLTRPLTMDRLLMSTPYEAVLAAIVLDQHDDSRPLRGRWPP